MEYVRIFISHASDDIRKAEEVRDYIEEQEYLFPILIVRDKQPNELIEKQVEQGIKSADYFVPILTNNSLNSIWVNQEIGYAKGIERQIYALIQDETVDNLKGFIHKHREYFIFKQRSFKAKYIELFDLIKENEGLGEPKYQKKILESDGDLADNVSYVQPINEKSLLHIKANLFNDLQEFVIYVHVGSENPKNEFRYIAFSNSNKINNGADHVRGVEYVYQFDLPGKTKYKKILNIYNAIRQSGLFFETFPNMIKEIRIRNINGELGKSNTFYFATTEKC